MSIVVNFAGASLLVPGSYSSVEVAQAGVSSPALGVVAIIGESDEGIPYSQETGLSAVSYGADEFAAIVDKYVSGELVDAAKIAISPSNDPQILGGAQELVVMKTNSSVFATLSLPQGSAALGTLKAKRSGAPGNQISASIAVVSGKAIITLNRLDKGVSEISSPLGSNPVLTIQCTDSVASAATMTIASGMLTTTVTGGTTAPLSIDLTKFFTVSALASYIAAQPGYSASPVSQKLGSLNPSVLDSVTALSIKTAALIKKDAYEVSQFFSASALVSYTPTLKSGLPTVMSKTFMSGGARGATSQAAIQACIDALLARRVNFIVPLFSRDAASDIADGLTDSASNYDIHATHAAIVSHVNQASTVKGRKERQGFVGFKDSVYDDVAEQSANLSAARVQIAFQDIDVVSASTGLIALKQPHMLALISAAMKASALVGLPNTFKQPSISGFYHPSFDPSTQAEKAISDNLLFVEKSPTGSFRFVLDNSTYSSNTDAWIYNRPSVLYAADTAAYSIRLNTEQFVGRRNSDVSEESIKNLMIGVMDNLRTAGIIVADNNTGGRGYKNLSVKINGSIVTINVTLALVEGLEFILSDIKVQRAG